MSSAKTGLMAGAPCPQVKSSSLNDITLITLSTSFNDYVTTGALNITMCYCKFLLQVFKFSLSPCPCSITKVATVSSIQLKQQTNKQLM